jgi:hypothetical protein
MSNCGMYLPVLVFTSTHTDHSILTQPHPLQLLGKIAKMAADLST